MEIAKPKKIDNSQKVTKLYGCDAILGEVKKYKDWNSAIMLAIARAESGCRHDATGDNHLTFMHNGRKYGYSVSAFQVRILPGREPCASYDIVVNTRCANNIFKSQGYKAWTVYNTGKYKKYM